MPHIPRPAQPLPEPTTSAPLASQPMEQPEFHLDDIPDVPMAQAISATPKPEVPKAARPARETAGLGLEKISINRWDGPTGDELDNLLGLG